MLGILPPVGWDNHPEQWETHARKRREKSPERQERSVRKAYKKCPGQRKRYARTAGKGRRNSGQTVSEPRENARKSKRFSQSVTVNGRNTYRTR